LDLAAGSRDLIRRLGKLDIHVPWLRHGPIL